MSVMRAWLAGHYRGEVTWMDRQREFVVAVRDEVHNRRVFSSQEHPVQLRTPDHVLQMAQRIGLPVPATLQTDLTEDMRNLRQGTYSYGDLPCS